MLKAIFRSLLDQRRIVIIGFNPDDVQRMQAGTFYCMQADESPIPDHDLFFYAADSQEELHSRLEEAGIIPRSMQQAD